MQRDKTAPTSPRVSLITPFAHSGVYVKRGVLLRVAEMTLSAATSAWRMAAREFGFGVFVSATSPQA